MLACLIWGLKMLIYAAILFGIYSAMFLYGKRQLAISRDGRGGGGTGGGGGGPRRANIKGVKDLPPPPKS
jgi:hypothetical protein